MQIAILSGGLGTRLRPLIKNIPKSMIPVEGRPFLQYQLELLKKNGIKDILLCTGYLSEKIKEHFGSGGKYGVRITYSSEGKKLLGTAGALKKAEKLLEKDFFVMYGDSYLPVDYRDIYEHYKRSGAPALMSVYRNNNRYDKSNVRLKDGKVAKYEKNSKDALTHIDYGISVLNKSILANVLPGQKINLEEIYAKLSLEGKIAAYVVKRRFYEIGSVEGLEEFRKYIKNGRR